MAERAATGSTLEDDGYDGLPGADLVRAGLRDLRADVTSEAALLVRIGRPHLHSLGVPFPPDARACAGDANPERELYRLLAVSYGDAAHSRYNALIRRLVSFERALQLQIKAPPS